MNKMLKALISLILVVCVILNFTQGIIVLSGMFAGSAVGDLINEWRRK